MGAIDFVVSASGHVSWQLQDLRSHSTVDLVMPSVEGDWRVATQATHPQSTAGDARRGKALQQLGAFLRGLAAEENPGVPIKMLPTEPFKDPQGQDYVQLDAGWVAGHTLYAGEHRATVGDDEVDDTALKRTRFRRAMQDGRSPDLAAALQGVTHVKLFLAGDAVRPGLDVQQLAELAAREGVSLLLPSGQALGLAGKPAPAVPL